MFTTKDIFPESNTSQYIKMNKNEDSEFKESDKADSPFYDKNYFNSIPFTQVEGPAKIQEQYVPETYLSYERSPQGFFKAMERTRFVKKSVRIPTYQKALDTSKVLFLKLGSNPMFCENLHVYIGHKAGKPHFVDIKNPSYIVSRNLHFPSECGSLLKPKYYKDIKQVGWFVIEGHKFGFMLKLNSIRKVYDGILDETWKRLLKSDFFLEQFRKYAYYFEHELEKTSVQQDISGTEIDDPIKDNFCPFADRLFLHQKQEVGWMFNLEVNPEIKVSGGIKVVPFLDTGYYIDPITRDKLLDSPEDTHIPMDGGILASQIGSGKTISMIGLMSLGSQIRNREKKMFHPPSDKDTAKPDMEEKKINKISDETYEEVKNDPEKRDEFYKINLEKDLDTLEKVIPRYDPSIVIVTKNILHQWFEEFRNFAPNLRVLLLEKWSDLRKIEIVEDDMGAHLIDYDVILTHRKMIEEGEEFKKNCPKIFNVQFRRIIIDELHELTTMAKQQQIDPSKKLSKDSKNLEVIDMDRFEKILHALKRQFTWGMTGTPDNLGYYQYMNILFRMLKLDSQYNQINNYTTIKNAFVRHCMRANPCKVNLPGLKKDIVNCRFYQMQNILYKGKLLYAMNQKQAQELCSHLLPQYSIIEEENNIQVAIEIVQDKHKHEVEKIKNEMDGEYDQDRTKFLEERIKNLENEHSFYNQVIKLMQESAFMCPICMVDVPNKELVITGCLHALCVECYERMRQTLAQPECPVCRTFILQNQIIVHPEFRDLQNENKLTAIMSEVKKTDQEDKVIIFTQFHSLVERLEQTFEKLNLSYLVLRGTPGDINISLNKFRKEAGIKVLLMSIEQSASGINVTDANHVFFAHPIFGMGPNKAAITYNQCIGRAYRIGQGKPVNVKIFVTKNSLEEEAAAAFKKEFK